MPWEPTIYLFEELGETCFCFFPMLIQYDTGPDCCLYSQDDEASAAIASQTMWQKCYGGISSCFCHKFSWTFLQCSLPISFSVFPSLFWLPFPVLLLLGVVGGLFITKLSSTLLFVYTRVVLAGSYYITHNLDKGYVFAR